MRCARHVLCVTGLAGQTDTGSLPMGNPPTPGEGVGVDTAKLTPQGGLRCRSGWNFDFEMLTHHWGNARVRSPATRVGGDRALKNPSHLGEE